jgi:hypothetical protein
VRNADTQRCTQFQVTQFQIYEILKKQQNEVRKLLKRAPNFLLAGIKAPTEAGGGRILLGDNKGGGKFVPRPIRFLCALFWISTGPLLYTYIYS